MRHQYFFQYHLSSEQLDLAQQLVEYSIAHHPITDIFAKDPQGKERQREFRHTGTLGEIAFADAYQLPRPTRSFGAIDGQDFGQDFRLPMDGKIWRCDLKTMQRQNNRFKQNYVLNLPAYQVHRPQSLTDCYFCISLHRQADQYIASFLGYIPKNDIISGSVGTLYVKGTTRTKDNKDQFVFQRDTYEVEFKDINSPPLSPHIRAMAGFRWLQLQKNPTIS